MTAPGYPRVLAVLLTLTQVGCLGEVTTIHGEGATFPAPLYARWIALFERERPDIAVEYTPAGSSAGIRAITNRTVESGASDALLTPAQIQAFPAPLLNIPTALGPVVMAYNLPDLGGELTLSGEVIAGIYLGRIERWNDPAIKAINPSLMLPDVEIHAARRADGSGTTYIFTDYLWSISAEWRERIGRGTTVRWPLDDDWTGIGNDGVAHRVLLLPGGIGYLELRYAHDAGLDHATLINRAGNPVRASVDTVLEAERNALAEPGSLIKPSLVDAPGEGSYPIAGFTYLLVYRDLTYLDDARRQSALVDFFTWALTEGQNSAADLGYAPLPPALQAGALDVIATIIRDQPAARVSRLTPSAATEPSGS